MAPPDPSPRLRKSKYVHSGCTLLDCACTGGNRSGAWPLGRVINIVGDKSTGKTLLAIEACANFSRKFPRGKILYREVEAAFDENYAGTLGLPLDKVEFGKRKLDTVEDFEDDLIRQIERAKRLDVPAIYVLDSLDALTTRTEKSRAAGKQGWNTDKSIIMSELFRKAVRSLEDSKVLLVVVSQVRDAIGVQFGKKQRRSGGKALDFYASLVVWLYHKKKIVKTIRKQKRVTGVRIHAQVEKNKIANPFRDCEFVIKFGFGVEDLQSNLEWLLRVERTREMGIKPALAETIIERIRDLSDEEYEDYLDRSRVAVCNVWRELEKDFMPKRRKYA